MNTPAGRTGRTLTFTRTASKSGRWSMSQRGTYANESCRNFYLHRHQADSAFNAPFLEQAHEASFARAVRELGFKPPSR